MQELQPTKTREMTIPTRVKRYQVAFYTHSDGWLPHGYHFFTTPESALEDFLRTFNNASESTTKAMYYSVCEIDLEIPVR